MKNLNLDLTVWVWTVLYGRPTKEKLFWFTWQEKSPLEVDVVAVTFFSEHFKDFSWIFA